MASKSKQGPLAKVHAACRKLQLDKVKAASWTALREAECALSLDLQVDIEHVSAEDLLAVAKSLEPVRTKELGAQLWEWLMQPASTELGEHQGIPRVRALLVLLGQVCGNSSELVGAAGAAYLALLMAEGADQQWSILFQPGIFRQILRALRGLRRGDLKPKKDKKETEGADNDAVMVEAEVVPANSDEAASEGMSTKDALELLGRLAKFFLERGLGSSVEASALVVEEFAMLVLRPLDDTVARHATTALTWLVARAGSLDDIRRVAAASIRAVMPALLMTQERLTSFQGAIPRPLQQARATALNFVCGLIRNHPELLTPQAPPAPAPPEEEEGGEAPKKRGRRRGPGKRGAEDEPYEDGADEEADEPKTKVPATAEEGAAGKAAEAEAEDPEGAEKKGRRRRPRGNGVDDPVVATLELLCLLSPDRSEWRSLSADSVITVLCHAADVERRLEMVDRLSTAVKTRTNKKTHDPAWDDAMNVDAAGKGEASTTTGVALPLCDSNDTSEEGTLVAPLDSEPHSVPEAPNSSERFLLFLERFLESERVSWRSLATEVAVTSLERSGQLARRGAEDARAELVKKLLLALIRRCADAVPSVRGRALGGVATALQYLAKCETHLQLLRRLTLDPVNPQYINLQGMFSAAAMDEKPTVRRCALGLFDATIVILHDPLGLTPDALTSFFDLKVLATLSADESILVRKACVSSLALLMCTCPQPRICELWVRNVLPLVLDVELSVAERALDELEAAVINPLVEGAEARAARRADNEAIPLPMVLNGLDSEATEYLQRGLKQLSKRNEGRLPQRFVDSLVHIIKDCVRSLPLHQWPPAVWSMLEEATCIEVSGSISCDLIIDAWILFSSPANKQTGKKGRGGLNGLAASSQHGGQMAGLLGTKILHVLEHMIPSAPQERLQDLMDSLCGALASFTTPSSMIRAMMCAIERIEETWKARKLYAERAKERATWRASFLKSIQAMLSDYVRADVSQDVVDSQHLCGALFTLGELAIMDISIISDGIVTQVQTIATNTIWRGGKRVDTDSSARGQAFATLGKFCLRKEALAKKSVELLVLHLNPNESLVVRNNVLVVLGDLSIHYTSLVDRFVPCMTGLLRDDNEILRKQAAMILASLLSEDFIKFRGSIMLRFLYVLSDPSTPVRSFVESVFARILHARNSTMFSQNFLDVICALNGWTGLPNFQSAAGNEDFSLVMSPSRRAMIYRYMLTLMSNDQKFNVCAQIVTTLLVAFVDAEEKIDLPRTIPEPAGQTLSDGLALLCCREMRICFTTQKAGQDEEGEADGSGDKASAEAARGVLSSILKRNMCENIVPVLIQLKNLMEARHSPFLRQLRHCLREILRDFKDDLKDMLAGDAQLASEIAFDLRAQDHDQVAASAKEAQEKPMLPHLGGASRRVSLGSMLKTPNPKALGLLQDIESPNRGGSIADSVVHKARRSSVGSAKRGCEVQDLRSPNRGDSIAGSVIPKARRSSMGSATRKSTVEELQLDSSPRPLVRKSTGARAYMSPLRQRSAMGSPKHVPSLPVVAGQEDSSRDTLGMGKFLEEGAQRDAEVAAKTAATGLQRAGKRRRGAQGSVGAAAH